MPGVAPTAELTGKRKKAVSLRFRHKLFEQIDDLQTRQHLQEFELLPGKRSVSC